MFHWTPSLLGAELRTTAYSPLDGGETTTVKYDLDDKRLSRRLGPGEWQTITITPGWTADTTMLDYILTDHGYRPGDANNV